ncbi:unnamed protein product, partial [Phaeothamnion confervicola]
SGSGGVGGRVSKSGNGGEVGGVAERSRGPFLRFSVCDTGIGVPANRRHELFKAFSQLQDSQNTGTGLGLYSVHQKAARLGGYCGIADNA